MTDEGRYVTVLKRMVEALDRDQFTPSGEELLVIEEAARAVVDGQEIRWCVDHEAAMLTDRECQLYHHVGPRDEDCKWVVRLLVEVPE